MTDIDHLAFIRRAEITFAEFVNAHQKHAPHEVTYNGEVVAHGYFHFEPEEFGREAEEVVRDLATMSIVYGHHLDRETAITELAETRAIQQTTPSQAVGLAEALIDELGTEMLFLEDV